MSASGLQTQTQTDIKSRQHREHSTESSATFIRHERMYFLPPPPHTERGRRRMESQSSITSSFTRFLCVVQHHTQRHMSSCSRMETCEFHYFTSYIARAAARADKAHARATDRNRCHVVFCCFCCCPRVNDLEKGGWCLGVGGVWFVVFAFCTRYIALVKTGDRI